MIAIGSDHGGIELKEQMIQRLKKRGIEWKVDHFFEKNKFESSL